MTGMQALAKALISTSITTKTAREQPIRITVVALISR